MNRIALVWSVNQLSPRLDLEEKLLNVKASLQAELFNAALQHPKIELKMASFSAIFFAIITAA